MTIAATGGNGREGLDTLEGFSSVCEVFKKNILTVTG